MMKQIILITVFAFVLNVQAQEGSNAKHRLDFASMYLEVGGNFSPSFDGKQLVQGEVVPIEFSATLNPYITWGGFHFWGHAEFYVTFPLNQINLEEHEVQHKLLHSVATGARIYPWTMEKGKFRPYIGFNWGGVAFQQIQEPHQNHPILYKDFMLNYDIGLLCSYKKTAFRLGLNYFPNNKWQYPLSKTETEEIFTPKFSFQIGVLYAFDVTKNNTQENIDTWNNYPKVSKLSYDAKSFGDFFIGAGPSQSFSLSNSDYNSIELPYLQPRLSSSAYFDLSLGYHFNKANFFTALSFRNPTYKTEGFGAKQTIHKTSLALEVNKFLTDYSGFAPYIGLNIAYDHIQYNEDVSGATRNLNFEFFEPGLTFGWDIVPGKTNEALILRTNLRWYPFSEFKIEGENFNFSQLEYNLIQVVFYPTRLRNRKSSQ